MFVGIFEAVWLFYGTYNVVGHSPPTSGDPADYATSGQLPTSLIQADIPTFNWTKIVSFNEAFIQRIVNFTNADSLLGGVTSFPSSLLPNDDAEPAADCKPKDPMQLEYFEKLLAAARDIVLRCWIMHAIAGVSIYWLIGPFGSMESSYPWVRRVAQVERRLKLVVQKGIYLAVSVFGWSSSAPGVFDDVANILHVYFASYNPSLTFSDVWAGLVLLCAWHNLSPQHSSSVQETPEEVPEWMNRTEAWRYFRFAEAIYGWHNHVFAVLQNKGLLAFLKSLAWRAHCLVMCQRSSENDLSRKACWCKKELIGKLTGLTAEDMLLTCYKNSFYETPFLVARDHRGIYADEPSIVICVRGTFSVSDALADMNIAVANLDPDEVLWFTNPGKAEDDICDENADTDDKLLSVHKGMLACAKNIIVEMDQMKVFKKIDDIQRQVPETNLVVTGHSLGAGVAAILSMLLRDHYPAIRCFAFSPPGCTVSRNALEPSKEFIFSVVMGNDVVPRLSFETLTTLGARIEKAVVDSTVPKYKIQKVGIGFLIGCSPEAPEILENRRSLQQIMKPPKFVRPPRFGTKRSMSVQYPCPGRDVPDCGRPLLRNRVYPRVPFGSLPKKKPNSFHGNRMTRFQLMKSYLSYYSYTCLGYDSYSELKIALSESGDSGKFQNLFVPGRIIHLPALPGLEFGDWAWTEADDFREIILSRKMLSHHFPFNIAPRLNDDQIGGWM